MRPGRAASALPIFFQAFHRIAGFPQAQSATVMDCEKFFQGNIILVDFRGRSRRGDVVPAFRENRYRGIGDRCRGRLHRVRRFSHCNVVNSAFGIVQNGSGFLLAARCVLRNAGTDADEAAAH